MIELTGENVTIEQVVRVARENVPVQLSAAARAKMQESRDYIDQRIASGEVMYGINTGFGAFSSVRINDSQLEELQRNLIRSHSMEWANLSLANKPVPSCFCVPTHWPAVTAAFGRS